VNFLIYHKKKKKKIHIRSGSVRGYQRLGTNITKSLKDWHEGIDLYCEPPVTLQKHYSSLFHGDTLTLAQQSALTSLLTERNRWPSPFFQTVFEEYLSHMNYLGSKIMEAIALSLGLGSNFFNNKYISIPFWVLRVIHYPPFPSNEIKNIEKIGMSCGEHTDYGCLTIINQDLHVTGALQVLRKDSNEWVNANPIPGAFVTNIGDMLALWSNGVYKSTAHRVMMKGNESRVSLPFFYEPNFDAVVKPLEQFLEKQNKEIGKKQVIMYGQHLINKTSTNFRYD